MPTRGDETSSSDPRGANRPKRVLILHVRAGVGHERAARAVESALTILDPTCEPIVRDALDHASPLLRRFYASTYNRLVDHFPRVWGFFYHHSAVPSGSARQRLRSRLLAMACRRFAEAALGDRPDLILCTQFLPVEVYARLRAEGFPIPITCAITDYFIHPIWVYPTVDRYFVATAASMEELVATGAVPPDRVEVTGIPVDPKFGDRVGQAEARRELCLDPDPARPTLLVMGGGFGWGPMAEMVEVVLALPERVQALVIAGRNEPLRRTLEKRVAGQERRIRIHGFTDRVHRFMEASDLLIGKAGGLTTSEAMAAGLPVLALRPIPGQEERNCEYLRRAGAGDRARDLEDLRRRLDRLIAHPDELHAMKERAASIGQPRSAFRVAESILSRLTPPGAGASIR